MIPQAIARAIDFEAFFDALMLSDEGIVYLVHFSTPIHHARHYLGWTAGTVKGRLAYHRAGQGARLLQVANDLGVSYEVVRVWSGSRTLERQLKNQHHGPRLCPRCGGG